MKNQFTLSILVGFLLMGYTKVDSQIENINIPDDLVMVSQPTSERLIAYTVLFTKGNCIQMFGANPNVTAKRLQSGKTNMNRGRRSVSIASVNLQSVSSSGGAKSFNFGLDCGESQVDNANVLVSFGTRAAANTRSASNENTPVKLSIPNSEVLTIAANSMPGDGNINQNFLRVNADNSSQAEISIARNTNQGQVIVGVYRVIGNPNPLALLDPKAGSEQKVVVNQDVFVIPLIRPKLVEVDGKRQIVFEVGDPEENGRLEIDEDE